MTEPWLLGRYEIVAELGKGAMGVVYRANDPMLNRILAIKTINTEEAGHEGMAEYEARFYTEAKAAGSLNHPNIIIIYDIGKSGHLVYGHGVHRWPRAARSARPGAIAAGRAGGRHLRPGRRGSR